MKKTFLLAKRYVAIVAVFALFSCSGDDSRSNDLNTSAATNTNRVAAAQITDCSTTCISDSNYYPTTDQKIISWGGPNNNNNSKTVDVEYYNTETHFVLKVRSSRGWSDLIIDGSSVWTQGPVAAGQWATYTYPLSADWKACDTESFTLQVAGNGPAASFDVNYNLIGICPPCETSFTGTAVSCSESREAVYTFTSKDGAEYFKIQGGLNNFTGADAVITVEGGNNVDVSQRTPGGSSNRIITVEGALGECETITVKIKWNSTNSGSTITGNWSVKDAAGNELSPSVESLQCN